MHISLKNEKAIDSFIVAQLYMYVNTMKVSTHMNRHDNPVITWGDQSSWDNFVTIIASSSSFHSAL